MRTFILLLALLALPVPAHAAEKAGVTLPDSADVAENALVLNGLGLRSVFIVKVYVGGLYLPEKRNDAADILATDCPRLIVMHFLRDVEAEKINEAWMEGVEDNLPEVSASLKDRLATFCSMMAEVKDGEELRFAYAPGTGTSVMVAGVEKGVVPGKDFSDALLSTWIGPDPGPGRKFKQQILGL